MMPIHHLRPTMVTGGLLADDVFVEIITGWPLHEAVKAAGYNQLRSLGILNRGEISTRKLARCRQNYRHTFAPPVHDAS